MTRGPSGPARVSTHASASASGGAGWAGRTGSSLRSPSPSPSPSPSNPPALAPVTDTISLFGFICPTSNVPERVIYTRNPALPEPADSCRTAGSGQLTIVVADPADHGTVYDRVETGPNGYANAVVPVGQPFVLLLLDAGQPVSQSDVSPVYRLNADPSLRQPMAVRLFRIGPEIRGAGPAASPAARPSVGTGATPVPGTMTEPITILGLICASPNRAGIYDYLSGLVDPAGPPPGSGPCRRATVDELEFLLLDNDNPSGLYDDALTGIDGVATAQAPIDQPFFVTEFDDDPAAETGLPGGSPAITIAADPAARQPVTLTVIRNVAPDALDLPAGRMLLSTVVCPSTAATESLTVLGPAPTILIRPDGATAATPQPGVEPGCEEGVGDYEIAPYGDATGTPVAVSDGTGDGALVVPLPATLTSDGTRAFAPYRITETRTGLTATFDIQEGAWTSLRVVLIDRPATPVPVSVQASGAGAATAEADGTGAGTGVAALPATPVPASDPATGGAMATPVPTATSNEDDSGGVMSSPVRLLWAALAILAIATFLMGAWVLRRPGHRW